MQYSGLDTGKPTSIWCCTPSDVAILLITMVVLILLTVTGISIGIASAAIGAQCGAALPNGDTVYSVYNATGVNTLYVTGDMNTVFVYDTTPDSTNIIVTLVRSSLKADTYKQATTSFKKNDITKQLTLDTVSVQTDFTDCVSIKRTIIIPQSLVGSSLNVNIWKNALIK
ncbi:hypothetical protein AKO1_013471 [Acrasis kona]|uniref:Uncharacterized protein n=1 Tax=Acrasis kona TaxID=1008807 RepID=A0AAW2ZJY5_9EUKA